MTRFLSHHLAAIIVLGAVCSAGCSKDKAVAEAEQPSPSPGAPAKESAGDEGGAVAKAKLSESNFELELKPVGDYQSGTEGHVEIVLSAKKPYKCNDQYPYKFKLEQADGVKFAADVVKKDAATVAEKQVTMKVAFTPESAGQKKISGQFAFSVCTEDKCLIEKRALALNVDVK